MGFVEKLLLRLFRHVDIEKEVNGEKVCYLRRFYLIETRPFKLYLHIIKRSDDDPDPHDHPWDFTTLILKNGYIDESYVLNPWGRDNSDKDELSFLSVRHRKAEHVHQVKLKEGRPAWTLVVLGKYRRKWGFVTKDRWVLWREYLNFWGEDPYDKPELQ
jgi:hypothetical protein